MHTHDISSGPCQRINYTMKHTKKKNTKKKRDLLCKLRLEYLTVSPVDIIKSVTDSRDRVSHNS